MIKVDNFIPYIYEAAYVALHTGYFKDCKAIPDTVARALKRILDYACISGATSAIEYINTHNTLQNKAGAGALLKSLKKPVNFFDSLNKDELFLYHSANYDISKEYGRYLSGVIDFSGMSLADIGGSSGGLLSGINHDKKTGSLHVFDRAEACETGELLSSGINFIPCDFFNYDFTKLYFDAVIFSNVVHDWPDADCLRLLSNTSCILRRAKYVIIHEDLLYNNKEPVETLMYGLRLSINVSGARQRNIAEITSLINKAAGEAKAVEIHNFGPLSAIVLSLLPDE